MMKCLLLLCGVLVTTGCGDAEFPTGPTREVPAFYPVWPAGAADHCRAAVRTAVRATIERAHHDYLSTPIQPSMIRARGPLGSGTS